MLRLSFGLAALAVLSGCASVTTGGTQPLLVTTTDPSAQPVEADCELRNDKGLWSIATPGSVLVRQSFQDLAVSCRSATHAPGVTVVKSTTKPMTFGNVLVGGLIGATVDMASGAAYRYPGLIAVTMGAPIPGAAPPARNVAAALATVPAGATLTYRTTDLFTQVGREASMPRASAGPWRARPVSLGDMSDLEPPEGWLQDTVKDGMGWKLDYEASDGTPGSRMNLTAQVLRRERVSTPAGVVWAYVVEYRGTASRSNGTAFNSHAALIRILVDVASQQPVRFESEITGSFGSQGGRPSRERTELVRIDAAARAPQ